MTREEHLEFCKICKNKSFDINKGIVCGLTNEIADFEESCPDFSQIEKVSYLENKKKSAKAKKKERKREVREKRKQGKEKISLNDVYLIAIGALTAVFINRILVYADYTETTIFLRISFFIPFLLFFTIIHLFRKKDIELYRFFGDTKFRFLYSILTSILIVIYTLITRGYNTKLVAGFFGFIIIVFILSYFSFLIIKPIILIYKKEIIARINYKRTLLICFSSILFMIFLEKDLLIKRETVYWKTDNSLKWDNFRGYSNYLSKYGAAITSKFDYEIMGDSVIVKSFAEPHHSWVKRSTKDSDYCLKHENYHFNISEIIARKFRQEISELSKNSINKKTIHSIFKKYNTELVNVQNKYDADTDHGLLIEKQKDWEYLIDSLLRKYEVYRNPLVSFDNVKENYKFFRQIKLDPQFYIIGKFPIDSNVASKIDHYCFYYKNGEVSKIEFKRKNKLVKDDYFGASIIQITNKKNSSMWQFLDSDLNKTLNNNGVHQVKIFRDFSKNQIVRTHFNLKQEIGPNNAGVAKYVWELDYKKRRVEGHLYDQNNNRITDKDGFYLLKVRYDGNNNVIEQSNYNKDNQLTETLGGIAVFQYEYDIKGNEILVRSLNSKRKPTPFDGYIAEANYSYDEEGRIISESFNKADESPYYDDERIVVSHYKYDEYSNLLEESYYGINKNLIIDEDGLGKIKKKYDSSGNTVEAINYDAYDNYLNDINGFCKSNYTYDSSNRVISQVQYYVDSLNTLCHLKTIKYEYDKSNNLISESYFNELDSLFSDSTNASILKFQHDQNGNLIKVENYDENGNLMPVTEGISIFRYKYDERNNKILAAYYNEKDMLTNAVDSIAYDKYFYNNKNQLIERRYYDCNNKLTKNSEGVEIIKWVKDNKGNILQETYYNNNGNVIEDNDGIAQLKIFYNKKQNNTKIEYYNKKLELVKDKNDGIAIIKYKYDKEDNLIETAFYDYNDKLLELPEGYAIEKQSIDKYGRVIRREFLDKFQYLTVTSNGYASINWEYDRNDNIIAEIYKDENDELIEDAEGYAIYNWIHNRNGDVLKSYGFTADKINLTQINYGPFNSTVNGIYYYSPYSSYTGGNNRIQTTYYENGQKESEVKYVNGKPDGAYRTWYKSGELESEIMYIDGMRTGKMVEYYKNGKEKRVITYEDNIVVNNSEITYHENGKVNSIFLGGKWKEYDEDGILINEEEIVNI